MGGAGGAGLAVPHFGNLLAADVWAATTRELSAFDAATFGVPADVWAAATRTLTDLSVEEIVDVPEVDSVYPGATVMSSATVNTFGSWSEAVADVGAGKRLIGAVICVISPAVFQYEVEVGEGESGSEAAITRTEGAHTQISGVGQVVGVFFPLLRSLTDNARLSARMKVNMAGAKIATIQPMIA